MIDFDRFLLDALADAMASATARQWRERAAALRAARPREGDFHGEAGLEAQRDRWRRLTRLADACDAKADLMERAPADVAVPELAGFSLWEAA